MGRRFEILASLVLILTLSGCVSLNKTREQNQGRNNLNTAIQRDELVLVTVENKNHDLVPLCGRFVKADERGIYIHHSFTENREKAKDVIQRWWVLGDAPVLGIKWKNIRSIDYCLRNTPDRKPLYQNYDP